MHFRSSRKLLAAISTCALIVGAGATLASARSSHHHRAKTSRERSCARISKARWGTLTLDQDPNKGKSVDIYTLNSGGGMKVEIGTFGGIVQSIRVPDRAGGHKNVALGFPDNQAGLTQYETMFFNPPAGGSGNAYFGAIIGRYANRIANHSFTLNGTTYNLVGNNGPNNINTLHGGPDAYNAQLWHASIPTTSCGSVALRLTYTDPAGKNGFPAEVANRVTYTVTRSNALRIDYRSKNNDSHLATVINLTNHTYFNLAGEGSGDVYDQLLQIKADQFQPTNAVLIPTGFASVGGTPFDFRKMKPIGRDIRDATAPQGDQLVTAHGYDHNWVLNGGVTTTPKLAAIAEDPGSGVKLSTLTTEPGVQMYSGNFLVGDWVGTSGHTYRQSDGFTLETQHYPDTPHHIGDPDWPSVVLDHGETFTSTTIYQFSTTGHRHDRDR